jgi:hypothetical protein
MDGATWYRKKWTTCDIESTVDNRRIKPCLSLLLAD